MKDFLRTFLLRTWPVLAVVAAVAVLRGEPLQAASGAPVENPHGSFKAECAMCHSSADWRTLKLSAKFDHGKFGFPLEAAHASASCTSCHKTLDFTKAETVCASCHKDPHRGEMGMECARCHGARSFTDRAPMVRAHELTKFPLSGSHALVECAGCHHPAAQGQLQFVGTSTECRSCHEADYRATRNPNHAESGFPMDCRSCHTPQVWTNATFDHSKTAFPLSGAHVSQACASCHKVADFKAADPACSSCHQSDYSAATPNHANAGFAASACASCHNTTAWAGAAFNHSTTSFALTGAHQSVGCNSCHSDGVYDGKPTTCISCHNADYSGASVNHTAAGFASAQCATCHTTTAWAGAAFNHGATSFALTGSHVSASCNSCHSDNVFNNKPTACSSCHQADYSRAVPNHATAGFAASQCTTCHNTTAWAGASFNHSNTSFALTGAHQAVSCNSCHADGVYDGKPTTCISCHNSDYSGAAPNHAAAGFASSQCTTCHSTTKWAGGLFNHTATSFALTGSHVTATCNSCHSDNVFNNKPTACSSCHMNEYNAATPNHVASGFSAASCATCHSTVTFAGATFNHSNTSFALTGAHQAVSCNSCHSDGVYDGKPTTCISCHNSDYSGAAPNHAAAGFASSQCATCHTTTAWAGGVFNHSATSFALTGSHVAATCNSCHSDNVFNNKPTACSSCHMSDYSAATPNHLSSGFAASACATCHSTTTWAGATFNHSNTSFALTGAHQAVSCNSCHSDGVYDGKPTTCISCHNSDYTGAAPNHTAAGFASAQCATCHTTTRWSGGVFNHTATSFPLTGSHIAAMCNTCHSDNVFNNKPTDCASCHMADYTGAAPNHVTSGFAASACATCHSTTTFAGAVFNHSTTSFALTGAHQAVACNSCHADGVYDGKPTACYSCHTSDYTAAVPTHTNASFPTSACGTCHTTTTWAGATFNHATTSFPLTGAHVATTCNSCHSDGVYDGKPTACLSCHQSDWGAAVPNHVAAGFNSAQCTTCHNTTAWAGARMASHESLRFKIYTGRHSTRWRECTDCHTNTSNFAVVTCLSCHPHDSKSQTDSNHSGVSGYSYSPTSCFSCHHS